MKTIFKYLNKQGLRLTLELIIKITGALSDFATASALSNYVTLATAQTITGVKTFAKDTFILKGIESKVGTPSIITTGGSGNAHITSKNNSNNNP